MTERSLDLAGQGALLLEALVLNQRLGVVEGLASLLFQTSHGLEVLLARREAVVRVPVFEHGILLLGVLHDDAD